MDPNTHQPLAQNVPPPISSQPPPSRGWRSLSIKDRFGLVEKTLFSVAAGIVGIFPWVEFNRLLFGDYLESLGFGAAAPPFSLYLFFLPFLSMSFVAFRLQNHKNRAVSGIGRWVGILCFSVVAAVALMSLLISIVDRPQSTQQTPQPIITQNPSTPTPTPDPTANWKTYTNSTYMLSFKYPIDLIPEEDTSNDTYLLNIFFKNPKETVYPLGREFSVEIRNKNKLEEEVSYRRWQLSHIVVDDIKEAKITTNGLEGSRLDYKFTSADQVYSKTILIVKGKYMYTIEGETSLIEQILSTFKFLDQLYPSTNKNISPDGFYTVTESLLGDNKMISITDPKEVVISEDIIQQNRETALNKMRELGLTGAGQIGYSFKQWIDDNTFLLQIVAANGMEFETLIDAKTGKINQSTFKRVQ